MTKMFDINNNVSNNKCNTIYLHSTHVQNRREDHLCRSHVISLICPDRKDSSNQQKANKKSTKEAINDNIRSSGKTRNQNEISTPSKMIPGAVRKKADDIYTMKRTHKDKEILEIERETKPKQHVGFLKIISNVCEPKICKDEIHHIRVNENRFPPRSDSNQILRVRKEETGNFYENKSKITTIKDFMLDVRGDRLNTFLFRWKQKPGIAWPGQLADAGFFYEGNALDVKCFECKIVTSVDKWTQNENPMEAHARININCLFVKKQGFKPIKTVREEDAPLGQNNYVLDEKVAVADITLPQNVVAETTKQRYTVNEQHVPPLLIPAGQLSGLVKGNEANNENTKSQDKEVKTATAIDTKALGDIFKDGLSIGDSIAEHVRRNTHTSNDSMNSQLTMDVSNPGNHYTEYKYPQFQSISSRLRSFEKWRFSHKQTPQSLSSAGYFYTGENDIVRCFCCDLGLAEWDPKDDPWKEHARHNPKCWFLINEKGTVFIEFIQKDWKKIYNAKHAAFDDKESRIATFDDWRKDIEQTPEILADAGFFFTGDEDVVRCHYCDGGLRNWEPGDIPWQEHARWFPFCKYLIKMKGREYIEEVKRITEERQRSESTVSTATHLSSLPEDIRDLQPIKELQEMKIEDELIRSAVSEFRNKKGHTNFTTAELITLIFEGKEQQQPKQSPFAASSIVQKENEEEKDPQKIKETNRQLKEKMKCIRCRTNDICMLFVNCGHRQTCEECADLMDFCPICDTRIKKRLKTFLS
ncbi:XIAP [Mytilus coruscus]|uniref:XIAP n=1 Tax=Mytilus coruscus TaxID=42192 RepID=A0A6J8CHX3_MYTCO|nr:XIAP [Mytilus coruscus]